MIRVQVAVRSGLLDSLRVSGHAPSSSHALLCNSVTCLTQTLMQACRTLFGSRARTVLREGTAELDVDLSEMDIENQIRLETLTMAYLMGIRGVSSGSESELNLTVVELKEK